MRRAWPINDQPCNYVLAESIVALIEYIGCPQKGDKHDIRNNLQYSVDDGGEGAALGDVIQTK